MIKSHSVETLKYQMIASSTRPDFQESLKNIQCPILLIGGSEDADFFKNGIQKINESVKNSELLLKYINMKQLIFKKTNCFNNIER